MFTREIGNTATDRSLEAGASIPLETFTPTLQIGAHERNRTSDLTLKKGVLYRLSYGGKLYRFRY